MLIEEPNVFLAYHAMASQLEECTEEQAIAREETYRKVVHHQERMAGFLFQYTPNELVNLDNTNRRLIWRRLPDLLQEPFGSLFR